MTSKKDTQREIDQARAEYAKQGGKVRQLPDEITGAETLAKNAVDTIAKDLVSRDMVRRAIFTTRRNPTYQTASHPRLVEYRKAKALQRRTTLW